MKSVLGIVVVAASLCLGPALWQAASAVETAVESQENSVVAENASGTAPLSVRIDALLATDSMEMLIAPPADDGRLLRRLSLDLRGVVPTGEELDAFMADCSPDRWERWVARFLDDPLCDEHLVDFLDRTLMLRRPDVHVDRLLWRNYLRQQVASNVPLDQFSRQLLFSPWWTQEDRATQKFYLDRSGDAHLIARDIGRIFLGRDMQCAQCHDHPQVDDYKQFDYYGLLAYFATSDLLETSIKDSEGKETKLAVYRERAANDAPFESVFDRGIVFRSGPRLPGQCERLEDYRLPTERYLEAAPDGAVPGVGQPPSHSRRQALAAELTARDNQDFVANWANRLWAWVFGRGLVQPIDMLHPDNPPSHPRLFALLAEGLREVDMQPRAFIAQLVSTAAYRRGELSKPHSDLEFAADAANIDAANIDSPPHRAQQWSALAASIEQKLVELQERKATRASVEESALAEYDDALETWRTVQAERAAQRSLVDAAEVALLEAQTKAAAANEKRDAAQKRQLDNQARIALLEEAASKLQQAADLAAEEDAELQQAIDLVGQRSKAAHSQATEIEKSLSAAQTLADSLAEDIQNAHGQLQQALALLDPIRQRFLTADQDLLATRSQWTADRSQLNAVGEELDRYLRLQVWLQGAPASEPTQGGSTQGESTQGDATPGDTTLAASTPSDATGGEPLAESTASVPPGQLVATAAPPADGEAWMAVCRDCAQQFASRPLRPLTPEQLCWSLLRVTGQLDKAVQEELAKLNKSSPLDAAACPQAIAERQREAVRAARDQFQGQLSTFVALYASGPDKTEDDFFASADQALFTANAGSLAAWIKQSAVTQQAQSQSESAPIAQLLYWSLLCRQPSVEEMQLVADQLAAAGEERENVIQEMVWSLLVSAEFRFYR
ncbi:MAG: DUF1549 domain-containing protein [Planctomycetales bacterium]|nr:DUF1549 domain-containing protein [Planctomycetales bacterium]